MKIVIAIVTCLILAGCGPPSPVPKEKHVAQVKDAVAKAGGVTNLLKESRVLFARLASETNFVLDYMTDNRRFAGLAGITNLGDVFRYNPVQPDRLRIRIHNSHFDTYFIELLNPDRPEPSGFERIAGNVGFIEQDGPANWSQQRGGTASAVEYRNKQYGFGMTFPADWSGYSVVVDTWHGRTHDEQGETTGTYTGPEIIMRHPQWTAAAPWQDIPVMVFTHDEWALVAEEKLGVSAAPIGPSKLGANAKFVFALPPRWIGFADAQGQDEAGKVPETFRAF